MEVVGVVAVLAGVVFVTKQAVEFIRARVSMDGAVVILVALVISYALAWFFDLQVTEALIQEAGLPVGRDLPVFVDYLVAAVAVTAIAGYLHDKQKALAEIPPAGSTNIR